MSENKKRLQEIDNEIELLKKDRRTSCTFTVLSREHSEKLKDRLEGLEKKREKMIDGN